METPTNGGFAHAGERSLFEPLLWHELSHTCHESLLTVSWCCLLQGAVRDSSIRRGGLGDKAKSEEPPGRSDEHSVVSPSP